MVQTEIGIEQINNKFIGALSIVFETTMLLILLVKVFIRFCCRRRVSLGLYFLWVGCELILVQLLAVLTVIFIADGDTAVTPQLCCAGFCLSIASTSFLMVWDILK